MGVPVKKQLRKAVNLMIDLETLGTNPDAPVISIGAVFFDKKELKEEFYATIDVKEQIALGRKVTGDTLQWWMSQDDAAKNVFKEDARDVTTVLIEFIAFCKTHVPRAWGNGSTFDISIMEDIFRQYDLTIPWQYFNVRDFRTFKQLFRKKLERAGTHHNALDDAKYQANYIIHNLEDTKFELI